MSDDFMRAAALGVWSRVFTLFFIAFLLLIKEPDLLDAIIKVIGGYGG